MSAAVTVTYFVEVLSSWCHWAEPSWQALQQQYDGRVNFRWRIALMRPEDFPLSIAQTEWFYRRSGTIMRSPYMLNAGWVELERAGDYQTPNLVAEAGRQFLGEDDDRIRLALAHAALREGQKIGDLEVACTVAARASGVDRNALQAASLSSAVAERVAASTATFHAHQLNQRPAFVLEDAIGDKAVFSGLVRMAPVAAAIDVMLEDTAAYASHAAHFGPPPTA
jgi:predicted DsbA family dithiol-disulfide isomerase